MSIPLVFFCALLNLALGYELAVRLGYGQASPALRWARGNVLVIMPAPVRLQLAWLTAVQDRLRALRSGGRGSRLPSSTAGPLAWFDVTQQWLQKLHAAANSADDCLMELRSGAGGEGALGGRAVLHNLIVEQKAALAELKAHWRRWKKHIPQATDICQRLDALNKSVQKLATQIPGKKTAALEIDQVASLAEALAKLAAQAHAIRDALWLALAEIKTCGMPETWKVDQLTSLATPWSLKLAWDALPESANADFVVVGIRLLGLDEINRQYGTRVGDRVIRSAAVTARQVAPEATAMARLDGTTLVWVEPGRASDDVQPLAEAVAAAISAIESEVGQELLHVSATPAVVSWESSCRPAELAARIDASLATAAR